MTTLELVPEPAPDTQSPFDAIKQTREDGSEFWSARDLMLPLGYAKWQNFVSVVDDARRSTEIVGAGQDQFTDSSKLINIGKGGVREVGDVELTRYGAYMVILAGDGRKPEIAAAKDYFAVQTRFAEVVQENPALLAPVTEAPRALSAREVGTLYSRTLDAYTATVTTDTVDSPAAHALAYSMQEFARAMTTMIKEAASAIPRGEGDTDSIEGAPVFSIDGPGSISPYVDRSNGAASEGSRLPDFRFLHAEETHELITWAQFAKSKGLPRCGRCAQGLSRRIMNAAIACGTSRGRVSGHNVFSFPVWEMAWEMHDKRYTDMHNDPARNHDGGKA